MTEPIHIISLGAGVQSSIMITALEAWSTRPTIIRFGCSIRLPNRGNFLFREMFHDDPEAFLAQWIQGAVGTIYTGPLNNLTEQHDGHLLLVPKVTVKYHP